MIDLEINLIVDGRSFGTNISSPTVPGFSNATEAIGLLTKEVEKIIAAVDASEKVRKQS